MNWQSKETMPKEGEFLATLRVYSASTGNFAHWDTHVLDIDEDGELVNYQGWDISDYEYWCSIPPYPPDEPAVSNDRDLVIGIANDATGSGV
jgi:hypothetical protein